VKVAASVKLTGWGALRPPARPVTLSQWLSG
jgi:hypothetical protein